MCVYVCVSSPKQKPLDISSPNLYTIATKLFHTFRSEYSYRVVQFEKLCQKVGDITVKISTENIKNRDPILDNLRLDGE